MHTYLIPFADSDGTIKKQGSDDIPKKIETDSNSKTENSISLCKGWTTASGNLC